jgi:hypothetical protein
VGSREFESLTAHQVYAPFDYRSGQQPFTL